MIAELYASMCGGAELWNRARLYRYMSNGVSPNGMTLKCAPCLGLEDLVPCVEDQAPEPDGYNLPELDPAPWYDPGVRESKNFAGLLVLETKLSKALDRRLVQNIGHGATATRARYQGRTMYVRGLLIGRTCCAVEYGRRWLTQALIGTDCDGCDGCALTFLTCTPNSVNDTECMMIWQDGQHIPYFRDPETSEWDNGLDYVRQMYGAELLEEPETISERGVGCGGCGCSSVMEVEFTIGLGNPWLYNLEEEVAVDVPLGGCSTDECMIEFSSEAGCEQIGGACADVVDCDEDPDCVSPPPPAGLYPLQQCGCVPLVVGRNCFTVDSEREWFDQALIVEVYAGSEPLRNLAMRIWDNPLGLDCCDPANRPHFADCAACSTLLVGHVPANGILRFDSAARDVSITCNGLKRPADRNVATTEGLPFDWLEVSCNGVCLTIDIDCAATAPDATASVWRVGREL